MTGTNIKTNVKLWEKISKTYVPLKERVKKWRERKSVGIRIVLIYPWKTTMPVAFLYRLSVGIVVCVCASAAWLHLRARVLVVVCVCVCLYVSW